VGGPPLSQGEAWLASGLLVVASAFLTFYANAVGLWPLHREGAEEPATQPVA
jgi:hypothetical protein